MKKLIFIWLIAFCVACSTAPKSNAPTVTTNAGVEIEIIDFNLTGQQSDPHFSPSGENIIYTSWDRPTHKKKQIYQYDLILQKEQRITFQDGSNVSPSFWDEKTIIYSSDTDELKENAFLSLPRSEGTQWLDLYRSDLVGDEIERLTKIPGLDDKALKDPWSPNGLFFISEHPTPGIYFSAKLEKKKLVSGSFDSYYINKNEHSLIGIEKVGRKTRLVKYLIKNKKVEILNSPSDALLAAADTPWDGLLLVAEPSIKPNESQLSFWDPKTQCLSLWKTLPGQIQHLESSPKGTGAYLVSILKSEKEQIFMLKPPIKTPTCRVPSPSATIKE